DLHFGGKRRLDIFGLPRLQDHRTYLDECRGAARWVDPHLGVLARTPDAKGRKEDVEERRVIRILEILDENLPIRMNAMLHFAEDAQGSSIEDTVEECEIRLAQILLERRHVVPKGREDDPVSDSDRQPLKIVLRWIEVARKATLPIDALAEGDS